MKVELFQDIVIKIGKNQQENWDLIDSSYEKFTWLHLNSYPSGHVVIEDENPSFLALESENPDKRKFKASFIGHLSDLENKR